MTTGEIKLLETMDHTPALRLKLIALIHDVSLVQEKILWFGERYPPDHRNHELTSFSPMVARSYLLDVLVKRLYADFYRRGQPLPQSPSDRAQRRADASHLFVEELSAANAGRGTRQAGWLVVEHRDADDATELAIKRHGLTLRAKPGEVVYGGDGFPGVGDEVELKLPKELPAISPGFYTVLSDEPYDAADQLVVRVYWNLYPWGAATLVRGITERLNGAGLPFRLKLVNHPDRYNRCDAAVLYLLKEDLDRAVPLLAEVYGEVREALKRPVPALTKRIAPGVGLAEDPGGNDSFGMHRCRLLAEGLVRGWERGAETVEERLAVVIETIEEAGIDPERPWLNPGSVDDYDFTFEDAGADERGDEEARRRLAGTGVALPDSYLSVAKAVGGEICGEAFWHEGWCNWLGVEPRDPNAPAHQGMTYSSLGPEPYGGSSGVALFLAELANATGDEEARKTALGAIRQALGRADAIEPPHPQAGTRLGLYTGRPGLALVAMRVGRLLEAEDVVSGARDLLDTLDDDLENDHEHDLLSGSAGGILALLRLSELLEDPVLVERAAQLGERLIEAAECDERGCSWQSIALPDSPNLTGLSHGAAGIGMALLELWQATGNQRFHDVATRAFDFERSWFNPEEGNWPDLRTVEDLAQRPDGPFPYAMYWCHGAPGIALSRLRAWELTGDARYRDEAIIALNTTRQAVLEAIEDGTVNYSLCHGLAGNAGILMLGSERLGEEFEHFASTVRDVAAAGIKIYAPEGRDWPCGTHGGWTPNLMLGLAGIGHFHLRLARPEIPPILL